MCASATGKKHITDACDIIEEQYGILTRHRGKEQGTKHTRENYNGKKTLTSWYMNFLVKKHTKYLYSFECLTWWKKLRTVWYSWVYDMTNVFVLALHINPFHLMLQSMLFRVMNTSIMGTPCDIAFYWKDGATDAGTGVHDGGTASLAFEGVGNGGKGTLT